MKEQELAYLKNNLFGGGLVQKLEPGNIREIDENELSPFCDYYGALIGAEKFLKDKKTYQKIDPDNFERDYSLVICCLLGNFFVPNHRTLNGRLNDRIRKQLQNEQVISGAKTLEELTEDLSSSREKIAGLHKLGFASSEKKKLLEEFDAHLNNLLDYGGLLQDYLFKLRPQVVSGPFDFLALFEAERKIVQALRESGDYHSNKDCCLGELSKLEITGEPIKEKSFFYKGEKYYSTGAFVKEWGRIINLITQLEEIKENPARKKFKLKSGLRLKARTTYLAARLAGGLFVAGLGTTGILYVMPSWRYELGLPVSSREKVEIHYEAKRFNDALHSLREAKGDLSDNLMNYWTGKILLAKIRQDVDQEKEIDDAYRIAHRINAGGIPQLIERGSSEVGSEEVLKTFFDGGYVKRGENIIVVNDYSTPKLAAQSHLSSLFNQAKESMEPEEANVLDVIKKRDVFYIGTYTWDYKGERKDFVAFLSLIGNTEIGIGYILQKSGNRYEIDDIKLDSTDTK